MSKVEWKTVVTIWGAGNLLCVYAQPLICTLPPSQCNTVVTCLSVYYMHYQWWIQNVEHIWKYVTCRTI